MCRPVKGGVARISTIAPRSPEVDSNAYLTSGLDSISWHAECVTTMLRPEAFSLPASKEDMTMIPGGLLTLILIIIVLIVIF